MTFAMMRWRLIGIASVGVLILASMVLMIYEVHRFRQFRAHPTWHVFEQEITDASVSSPLNRYLVFKPGSGDYNAQLYEWLGAMEFEGAPLDASNMRGFLANLSPTQLIRLTHNFASAPEPMLPHLKKKLFSTSGPCFFARTTEDELSEVLKDGYYDPKGEVYVEDDEGSYALNGGVDTDDPLTLTMVETSANPDGSIPWGIAFEDVSDAELRQMVVACIRSLDPAASARYPLAFIPKQAPDGEALLKLLIQDRNAILIAKLAESKSDVSTQAKAWLVENSVRLPDSQLLYLHQGRLQPEVRMAMFDRWLKERNDARAKAVFRQAILHDEIDTAVRMAKPLLDGADSSLKKDLIVILARNHMALGKSQIDEAFSGASTRRELFYNYTNYVNSGAMREYTRLSRHDYLEVGKSFPAYYCLPPLRDEESGLRAFLARYPWFPAVDDAHLRLASRLYLDRNLDQAEDELNQLEAADYVDFDAMELIPAARKAITEARSGIYISASADEWYESKLQDVCAHEDEFEP